MMTTSLRLKSLSFIIALVAFLSAMASTPGLFAAEEAQRAPETIESSAGSTHDQWIDLQPLAEHPRTSVSVVEQLRRNHYLRKPIDDALSSAMFDKYLGMLDGNRSYFLASDIETFESLRFTLDDALKDLSLIHI